MTNAERPAGAPTPAPVDSGAIGRLNEAERTSLVSAVLAVRWPDGSIDGLPTRKVAEMIADAVSDCLPDLVREHTDRALAEVEQGIAASVSPNFALRRDGSEDPQAAAYVEGLHDAHEIVRAARQEQGR